MVKDTQRNLVEHLHILILDFHLYFLPLDWLPQEWWQWIYLFALEEAYRDILWTTCSKKNKKKTQQKKPILHSRTLVYFLKFILLFLKFSILNIPWEASHGKFSFPHNKSSFLPFFILPPVSVQESMGPASAFVTYRDTLSIEHIA